jgi:putative transcriptional regulator
MIYSKLHRLRFEKEEKEGRKLTYDKLEEETGLSRGTLARLFSREPLERIDGKTLSVMCHYFGVGVGDVLEYTPEKQAVAA